MQLKQFDYISTKVSSRKNATTLGDLPDCYVADMSPARLFLGQLIISYTIMYLLTFDIHTNLSSLTCNDNGQNAIQLWARIMLYHINTDDHYNDVIMGAIAFQITSLAIVYLTVYSDADRGKPQSSAPLDFVRGIRRWPVNSPHKWPVTRKMFPFVDVIMCVGIPQYLLYSKQHNYNN